MPGFFVVTDDLSSAVCVIDDDEAVRDSLKLLLESHGLQVRDFASPVEFLERRAFRNCRCLVLDLHMPLMSGLELLETLREKNIGVPVVMVTGRPDPLLARRFEKAGLSAVLAKPVSDEELLDRIATAIATSLN